MATTPPPPAAGPPPLALPEPIAQGLSARVVLRTVLIVVLVALTLYLIYLVRRPLAWIFIAGFLAVALSGPVSWLRRRMPKGIAIALVYLGLILLPVLVAALLIPPIVEQVNNLIDNLPEYADDLQAFVNESERLRELEADYNITAKLEEEAAKLPARIGDAASILSDIGIGVVNSVFAAVTIIVLSIFLLSSGRGWIDFLADRQGPARADWLKRLYDRIGNAVANYVAGALGQALIAGILSWLVLSLLNIPYAASLAVIIFLLDLVPLVGATLGAIIVGFVTLFENFPTATIIWTIWSIVYQQLENNVIQPRIQARAVQVHPFVVLSSVLFGSTLFGVIGALLAIPIAAAIQISVIEYNTFRQPQEGGEPPPPAPGPQPPAALPPAPA